MRAWTALAAVWLTGCAATTGEVCPTLYPWAPADQDALADEIDSLDPVAHPRTIRALGEYAAVRAEIRACRK